MEKKRLLWVLTVSLFGLLVACQPVSSKGKSKRYSSEVTPAEDRKPGQSAKPASENEDIDGVVLEDTKDDQKVSPKPEKEKDCYKAEKEACDLEKQIFLLTNKLRKQEGRSPFKLSPKLSWTARKWSDQMGKVGIISHVGFPGQRANTYRDEFGSSASLSAENVAMNYTDSDSVADSFYEMWESSRGHRVNMLSDAESIGIGIAKSSQGAWYATQIFGD